MLLILNTRYVTPIYLSNQLEYRFSDFTYILFIFIVKIFDKLYWNNAAQHKIKDFEDNRGLIVVKDNSELNVLSNTQFYKIKGSKCFF